MHLISNNLVVPGTAVIRATSKGHIGSRIAGRLAASPDFNHAILIDGSRFYEAVPWHGVRVVPERVAMRGVVRYQDWFVRVPDIMKMREFLEEQLGAGYDWPGALGLPFRHSGSWQDPARWWCWELSIAGVGAGGTWLVDREKASGCKPDDLFKSSFSKTEVIHLRGNG